MWHVGRHNKTQEQPPDILAVWTRRCERESVRESGDDCLACPRRRECQRLADHCVGYMQNLKFRGHHGKADKRTARRG